ncbi:hypothetical protein ACQEVG_04425 [Streptomyces sp. CA-135486]|uniref:hypothetical protein n=1 Tax=Streptomyces sp. CA-135486 TaxID=3240049 RepID=UPI003D8D9311
MAVVESLQWAGVTPEQYDAVRTRVRWEEEAPDGAAMHAAWFESDGLHVIDIWDTDEQFQRFIADKIMPAVQAVGIAGQPQVKTTPLHRRFVAPGVTGAA